MNHWKFETLTLPYLGQHPQFYYPVQHLSCFKAIYWQLHALEQIHLKVIAFVYKMHPGNQINRAGYTLLTDPHEIINRVSLGQARTKIYYAVQDRFTRNCILTCLGQTRTKLYITLFRTDSREIVYPCLGQTRTKLYINLFRTDSREIVY